MSITTASAILFAFIIRKGRPFLSKFIIHIKQFKNTRFQIKALTQPFGSLEERVEITSLNTKMNRCHFIKFFNVT